MGASMIGFVEFDHSSSALPSRATIAPFSGGIDCLVFELDKDYDLFAALAGVRSRFPRAPLIKRRGLPPQLSVQAQFHFNRFGEECAGWLLAEELQAAVDHMRADSDDFALSFTAGFALKLLRDLAASLGAPYVRLVFNITD